MLLEEGLQKLLLLRWLQLVQALHQTLQEKACGGRIVWALCKFRKVCLGLREAVGIQQRCQAGQGRVDGGNEGREMGQGSPEAMPQVLRVAFDQGQQLRQLPGQHAGKDFGRQDGLKASLVRLRSLRAFRSGRTRLLLLVTGLSLTSWAMLAGRGTGVAAVGLMPGDLSCSRQEQGPKGLSFHFSKLINCGGVAA